jgi:hypothetical protein
MLKSKANLLGTKAGEGLGGCIPCRFAAIVAASGRHNFTGH